MNQNEAEVYLETTIPSFLTGWPSRDLVNAGQQQATRDWWHGRRRNYDLFASVLVMTEASRGDAKAASARLEKLTECQVLPFPEEAKELTLALLRSGLIPETAQTDAAHIAIASVHALDFLLSWNCRHIANAAIVEKVRGVCEREGFAAPVICTPHELMV